MLHTVSTSPYATSALSNCLRYAAKNSCILLMEDAVIAATEHGQWQAELIASGNRIYVLLDDVIARGLTEKISDHFGAVDMQGFVALTERHVTHLAW